MTPAPPMPPLPPVPQSSSLVPPPPGIIMSGDDKLWIVLSHLSVFLGVGFLLPLIIYLVKKADSPAVADQAREALNFHISCLLYSLLCIPLVFVLIGIPLLVILAFAAFVLAIVAAVSSADGRNYRYPLTIRFVR